VYLTWWGSVLLVFVGAMGAPLSAHAAALVTPDSLWQTWSVEPLVCLGLLATSWLYGCGVRRLWVHAGRGHGVSSARALSFAAGQFALTVALVSPLDALGGTLLSAHMAQHGLLIGVAPPLLLAGHPTIAFAWALRSTLVARAAARTSWKWLVALARRLASPLPATVLQGVLMWLWHAPAIFDAALAHEWLHPVEHLSFFVPALLLWQALLGERARGGAAFAAAFVTFMHSGLLGGLITMAPAPLYAVYVGRTDSWGITALDDQQLAGLFMWVPLGIPYLVAGLLVASRLVRGGRDTIDARLLATRAGARDERSSSGLAAGDATPSAEWRNADSDLT
jgi:putative membrane protein